MGKIFVTGIDTDSGKTIVTGLLAKYLLQKGKNVITQKIAQTGCKNISEDIEIHRKIMGIPLQEVDKTGETCPYIFNYPASPHLSARMEGIEINPQKIMDCANSLQKKYDIVLMEGVGGLIVPLTENYTVLNFIENNKLDIILVASSKLGSINHTLLSLEILKQRNIRVKYLIYNNLTKNENPISKDSKIFLENYIKKHFPNTKFLNVPFVEANYDLSFWANEDIL